MNRRLAIALAAFVVWIAITIIGGNITTGGEGSLLDSVQSGIGWTWVVAAGFILAVVLWQGWHDVALNRWADVRGWRLTWPAHDPYCRRTRVCDLHGPAARNGALDHSGQHSAGRVFRRIDVARRRPSGVPACHKDLACGSADVGCLWCDAQP